MSLPFRLTPPRLQNATKSYSSTLNLPRSSLPARPPIQRPSPYLRPVADDLYKWNQIRPDNETTGTFVLHDGPPYANGALHIGHALNKILKDIINRFWLGQGKKITYIPGWDCHGLPIEIKALQAQKEKDEKSRSYSGKDGQDEDSDLMLRRDDVAVRRAARQLAEKTIEEQMEGFKSWAVMGHWNAAYKTMEKSFELKQLGVFRKMVDRGRSMGGLLWSCQTRH